MIVLKNLHKRYGSAAILSDVSFEIHPREFVCITGPSGAGKSTLIHLLIGSEGATDGVIEIDGVDLQTVPPGGMQLYRRRVGVVFQDYKLLQKRTVAENVAFPLEVCGASDALITTRVPEVLARVGLSNHANALPRQLSGGEKARAAIARAIVHRPMILLADEPTGNVDPTQSLAILELLREINAEGTTIVLATHDALLVNALQTRVIRLDQGRVVRDSIGGYDQENGQKRSTLAETGSHNVFEGTSEMPQKTEIPSEPESPPAGSGKKIRITSIGRDRESPPDA